MENKDTSNSPIQNIVIEKYSPDWLRSFKGCEHYSNDEAQGILESLKTLSALLLRSDKKEINTIDNQHTVYLYKDINKQSNAA